MYKNAGKETEVVKNVDQISFKLGLNFHFNAFLQLILYSQVVKLGILVGNVR
jgi:hypothetical protein